MTPTRIIEVYKDEGGEYRWRVIAPRNGKITAVSGESFASAGNARKAATRERRTWAADMPIVERLNG